MHCKPDQLSPLPLPVGWFRLPPDLITTATPPLLFLLRPFTASQLGVSQPEQHQHRGQVTPLIQFYSCRKRKTKLPHELQDLHLTSLDACDFSFPFKRCTSTTLAFILLLQQCELLASNLNFIFLSGMLFSRIPFCLTLSNLFSSSTSQ